MGPTNPPLPDNVSTNILTQVRDSRISKGRKATEPLPSQPVIDVTTSMKPASMNTIRAQPEEEKVYVVMHEHSMEGRQDTTVFAVCSDLEEANAQARRCLEVEFGARNAWEQYNEFEKRDGTVNIEATGLEGDFFAVYIPTRAMKRKVPGPVAKVLKKKVESPDYVYVIRAETRIDICDVDEEGKIDSVEICGTFRDLEAANNRARVLPKETMEVGEDLEYEVSEEGGLLRTSVLDLMEGQMSVYQVEQHPVY